ncbi:STAS/SEC14 domain-containing protein [Kitasatospora sp. NPDC051853]|uniref:STAS/SEC14 domain-containing protein n=1 Tax=Kitasatospora sp. NPDC051853 TaxID=3364058 RepID=UPI00378B3877
MTEREVPTVVEKLSALPEGVIGFEIGGKLSAEDYRDVLIPALTTAAEAGGIRCVLVVREFDGMSGGAVWEDLKLGAEHLRSWQRVALVTDLEWMAHLTTAFGWMIPGRTRTFPLAERAEAEAWAAASD